MQEIKIIFFDIDGTLIDMNRKVISEKVTEALIGLKNKGIKLCIATGRSPMQLPKFTEVDFDAFLTYNGSLCFNSDQQIYANPINKQAIAKIISNAEKMQRPLSLATGSRLASNGRDDDLELYYSFGGSKLKIVEDFDQVAKQEDVFQVLMSLRAHEYETLLEDVDGARITAWWDRAVDIIPVNGGKGQGIDRVLDFYQLSRENAMAFGDGNNDLEMIQTVGHGVAMANASDELKAVADAICGSVDADGIYHYCKQLGLI